MAYKNGTLSTELLGTPEFRTKDFRSVAEIIMYLINKYGTDETTESELVEAIQAKDTKFASFGIYLPCSVIRRVLSCGQTISYTQQQNRAKIITEEQYV